MYGAAQVQYLVLDEADKMLEIGLQPQLDRIKQNVLPHRLSRKQAAAAGKQHVQVTAACNLCTGPCMLHA